MTLKINNTAINSLFINNIEIKTLLINGIKVFGDFAGIVASKSSTLTPARYIRTIRYDNRECIFAGRYIINPSDFSVLKIYNHIDKMYAYSNTYGIAYGIDDDFTDLRVTSGQTYVQYHSPTYYNNKYRNMDISPDETLFCFSCFESDHFGEDRFKIYYLNNRFNDSLSPYNTGIGSNYPCLWCCFSKHQSPYFAYIIKDYSNEIRLYIKTLPGNDPVVDIKLCDYFENAYIYKAEFSEDNQYLAITLNTSPYYFLINASHGTIISWVPQRTKIANTFLFTKDQKYLVMPSTSSDKLIDILDLNTKTLLNVFPSVDGVCSIYDIKESNDNKYLAVLHSDRRKDPNDYDYCNVTIYNKSDWSEVLLMKLSSQPYSCCFSENNDALYVVDHGSYISKII